MEQLDMNQPANVTGPATESEAVARVVRDLLQVQRQLLDRGSSSQASILAVPRALALQSIKPFLDEYLERPERKRGTSHHHTLDSFVAHVARFKQPNNLDQSVLFGWLGDPDDENHGSPELCCVYDYHEPGSARAGWGDYRAVYTFPLSDEWRAWTQVAGVVLGQDAFAEFLEDRIADVSGPGAVGDGARHLAERLETEIATPAQLMALSRGLTVNVGRRVTNAQALSSGEAQIAFTEEHSDTSGQPLRVPAAFEIAIPVFEDGGAWQLPVRLRYRVNGGSISWRLQPYRMAETLRGVMRIACEQAASETGLPLYWGAPE